MPEGAIPQITRDIAAPPKSVRVALPSDERGLYALLLDLEQDNGVGLPRSDEKVWRFVTAACGGKSGLAGIAEAPDGSIAGSVGIFACQTWYSDVWFLSVHWLFVRPKYRTIVDADDLFEFARWHQQDMSRRLNQDVGLEMSILGKRLPAKERLWSRHAKKIGALFYVGGGVATKSETSGAERAR